MYKKFIFDKIILILGLLFIFSCSSPNNPDSGNQGNNGGSTPPPPTGPTEEELIAKYGIDLGLSNEEISKKIKDNLKSYFDEMGSYRLIFIGTSKESYPNDTSLSFLTAKYASEINANNIVMDFSNVIFRNESIVAGMFSPGTTDTYEEIILKLVFPENGIKTIKMLSFNGSLNIREIKIPDSVITIEDYSFADCQKIEKLNLGNGVQTIGECAFMALESLKELVIPESVKSIGNGAFAQSELREKITIPASLISVGMGAFSSCPILSTVVYNGTSPSTINNNDAFLYCDKLSTLILPNVNSPQLNDWKTFLGGNFTTVKQ